MTGSASPKAARASRGRPRAGREPATIDEMMTAALHVFARDGFAGASVATINRQLGVSHNMIHQRYGSKEALWYAMVDWIFARGAERLNLDQQDDPDDLTPMERFRQGIIRYIDLQSAFPDVVRLISMEAAIDGPRLSYLYDHHIGPILARLAEPLKPLIRAKVLSRNDLRSLHFLIAHGATAPCALVPLAMRLSPADPRSKSALRRHAEFVADMIVAGLEARAAERRVALMLAPAAVDANGAEANEGRPDAPLSRSR